MLGTVDAGWSIVQDVMSFERVGIARYARCERLLSAAPAVLGDRWDDLPTELRARWTRMLTHCRRARLLAYRVVELQSSGRIQPATRPLPDRGHQTGPGQRRGADGYRRRGVPRRPAREVVPRRGRGPLAVLAGVDGVVGQHRDAAHPAVAYLVGRREMILDLNEDAKEYGARPFGRSRPPAAISWCSRPRPSRGCASRSPGRCWRARRMGSRPPHGRRRAGGRRCAVPQRRVLGAALSGRRTPGRTDRPGRRRAGRRGDNRPTAAPAGLDTVGPR